MRVEYFSISGQSMMDTQCSLQARIAFAILLLCAISLCACSRQRRTDSAKIPVLTDAPNTTYPMPPLKGAGANAGIGWVLLDNRRFRISDYRGKVLVLDFYATWCQPCRESIPHLMNLQQRYGDQGLQIVGLNVGGPDDRVRTADFAREFGIQYPLGFPDKSFEDLFLSDDKSIPQTFVFDHQGQAIRRFIGYGPSTAGELEAIIQNELKSRS